MRGNSATCSALCWLSVTPSTTHNQIEPFWCCFLSGWACVCSRSLWISPTNSPVRLGVSHAVSTPTGFFSQRFRGFISPSGTLDYAVCLAPQLFLPVYPHTNVDCIVCQLPPHPVHQPLPCHESSLPWLPISALAAPLCPSYLSE